MKLSTLLLLIPSAALAQTKTPTEKEAREYFAAEHQIVSTSTYYKEDGEIFDFYSGKNPGDIVLTGNEFVKVLGPKLLTIYECSMIIFDARKQPAAEIESIQKTIIANYNAGFTFQELAEKYASMENFSSEATIDFENLPEGSLKSGLEQHTPGEIFLVIISEEVSYIMIINNNPVKQKGITIQHALYE